MHEYTKRTLLIALLIVSAAIVPSLTTVVGFPDRSSELPRAATSPLFRHVWDKLLSSEVEDWIPTHADNCRQSEWTPESRQVQTRVFFRADLKPTLEGSLSAVGEYDGFQLSIRMCLIGCTPGRKSLFVSEHSARNGFYQQESHISGGSNATKDFQNDCVKNLRVGYRVRRGVSITSTGRKVAVSDHGPA